jgi:hypothetical protein
VQALPTLQLTLPVSFGLLSALAALLLTLTAHKGLRQLTQQLP